LLPIQIEEPEWLNATCPEAIIDILVQYTLLPAVAKPAQSTEGGFSLRKYETAIVWSTSLTEKEIEKELTKVSDVISAEKGTYLKTDSWGKRQLAYPIKKQTEGVYFFLRWDGEERVTAGIDKLLRINENCLRYLTLKVDDSIPEIVHVPTPEIVPQQPAVSPEPPAAEASPSAPEAEEESSVPEVEEASPAPEEEAEEKVQVPPEEEEPAPVEEEEPAEEEEEK
jgi:small subunit ribosomal protein S6